LRLGEHRIPRNIYHPLQFDKSAKYAFLRRPMVPRYPVCQV
jgi:hypothetical protein